MKLEDYMRHLALVEQRLKNPERRKLHIQYVGPSEHGGCHVTIFVMGTWYRHIHISEEAMKTPDLFQYTVESSLRDAVGVLLEEAVKIEASVLREDLDKDIELRKSEDTEDTNGKA